MNEQTHLMMNTPDYDALWKAVEKAQNNNHPHSVLDHLQTIIEAAREHGHTPHLIRALCTRRACVYDLNPDRQPAALEKIEAELQQEQRPLERAMWKMALAKSLNNSFDNNEPRLHRDSLVQALQLMKEAIEDAELLAHAQTKDYPTLFSAQKENSFYYNGDLLYIFTTDYIEFVEHTKKDLRDFLPTKEKILQILERNLAIYQSIGNRQAALATEIQRGLRLPEACQIEHWTKLKEEYLDLEGNVKVFYLLCQDLEKKDRLDEAMALAYDGVARYAKENTGHLRRWIQKKEQCYLDLEWEHPFLPTDKLAFYPGETYTAKLSYRNCRKIEIRFHLQEGLTGEELDEIIDGYYQMEQALTSMLQKEHSKLLFSINPKLEPAPAHRKCEEEIAFQVPQAGIYVLEYLINGKRKELQLQRCYKSLRLEWATEGKEKNNDTFDVVDAITGNPILTEKDHIYMEPKEEGEVYDEIVDEDENPEWNLQLFTDRAIYRPGQRVEVSGFLYHQKGDETEVVEEKKVKLYLVDSNGDTLVEKLAETDEWGTFVSSFELPQHGPTGRFGIVAQYHELKAVIFRVEAYKRPSFRLKIDPLPASVVWGEELTLTGSAHTYNGLPLIDARIRIAGTMDCYHDFLEIEDEPLFDHELRTDAEGRFSLTFTAATDLISPASFYLTLKLEALSEGGETQTEKISLEVETEEEEEAEIQIPMIENLLKDQEGRARIIVRESCFLFFRLFDGEGILIESRGERVEENHTIDLEWKSAYGDSGTLLLFYVKKGRTHQETFVVKRLRPDKRLLLKWETFRSYLQPGETETWTLRVNFPDGTPASAQLVARLYDASLDALMKDDWSFKHVFPRYITAIAFNAYSNNIDSFSFPEPYQRYYDEDDDDPSNWKQSLFSCYARYGACGSSLHYSFQNAGNRELGSSKPCVPTRTNFAETGFFFPRLQTDEQGIATLHFTLPDSLTEWKFSAFAHDKSVNFGFLHDTIIARKLLMVTPSLPRFLREGDQIEIPVTVRNISGQPLDGIVTLEILDHETETTIVQFEADFSLENGAASTVRFPYAVIDGQREVTFRAVARSHEFSDGEARKIPVLLRKIELTHAVPFCVKSHENYDQKLTAARKRLLSELEAGVNPVISVDACRDANEEVVKVVPQLLKADGGSSLDDAIALLALEVAAQFPKYHALSKAEINTRRDELFEHLEQYRTEEGGWSWYPGFRTSVWITIDILMIFARITTFADEARYADVIEPALRFVDQTMEKEVEEMRKQKVPAAYELHLRYLYICQLLKRESTATQQYLLELSTLERVDLTILGKAALAVVYATNAPQRAKIYLQSVMEYTVTSEEMGRYFETSRAISGWSSYRIPTQVYALEAFRHLKEFHTNIRGIPTTQIIDEMLLWLLQSKRTQVWNSSRATANAVYALLKGSGEKTGTSVCNGLTWGAVSATYQLPASEVVRKGNGFALERTLEVKREGKWVEFPSNESASEASTLHVGDAVRWVYRLTADRDFDHVVLRSSRPATFETLFPLSGIHWLDRLLTYRMPRETENEYFIEHLRKGTHFLTEEMRVVHAGHFDAGIACVQSVFAPEFVGNSEGGRYKVD